MHQGDMASTKWGQLKIVQMTDSVILSTEAKMKCVHEKVPFTDPGRTAIRIRGFIDEPLMVLSEKLGNSFSIKFKFMSLANHGEGHP